MDSVERLQRILLLKYLNFSLVEIKEMLTEENIKDSLKKQEELLIAQAEHLNQIIKAVKEVQEIDDFRRWEKILDIIHMTQQKEEIMKQYKVSDNLEKRINIHAYSTSKVNWYQWVFDGLKLSIGMKILDIGCGNGMLWKVMCDKLPSNLEIYLLDSSKNMLEVASNNLKEHEELLKRKKIQVTYIQQDAETLEIEETNFDRIIANHMLYHISKRNRPQLLSICEEKLAKDGMFYATTVGESHLRELNQLMKNFDNKFQLPNWMTRDFLLENGASQLESIFSNVSMKEQENDLLVPNPQAISDYVESFIGNAKEIVESRKEEWMAYLNQHVSSEHPFFIHKSAGAFQAFKNVRYGRKNVSTSNGMTQTCHV